jgi:hypothetical protein
MTPQKGLNHWQLTRLYCVKEIRQQTHGIDIAGAEISENALRLRRMSERMYSNGIQPDFPKMTAALEEQLQSTLKLLANVQTLIGCINTLNEAEANNTKD